MTGPSSLESRMRLIRVERSEALEFKLSKSGCARLEGFYTKFHLISLVVQFIEN